jgi:hypothetical protein
MEVPPENPNEFVRLRRFPPGLFETMIDWTTTQLRQRPPARGALHKKSAFRDLHHYRNHPDNHVNLVNPVKNEVASLGPRSQFYRIIRMNRIFV